MIRTALALCLVYAVLLPVQPVGAEGADLLEAVRLPDALTFCGEAVDLKHPDTRELFEREMLLTLWDRPQVILWLKRAPRYMPFIETELRSRGLPEDLKYLVVAESALRPHAGSPKGAIGFWQMMPETARRYGLRVDAFIDDRRDLWRSTPGALNYLEELHQRLGSWMLSAAAFNMGEEGLIAEMLEQGTGSYLDLYLSLETQRYLFRVLAAKLVFEDPVRFGYDLTDADRYPPLLFQTAPIDFSGETPISLLAAAANTTFKEIKRLNPHIRGHYIQSGRQEVRLPPGSYKNLQDNLNQRLAVYGEERRQRIYIVQSGDSLSTIAEKHHVPLAALIIWNRIDLKHIIHPGDRLVIFPRNLNELEAP